MGETPKCNLETNSRGIRTPASLSYKSWFLKHILSICTSLYSMLALDIFCEWGMIYSLFSMIYSSVEIWGLWQKKMIRVQLLLFPILCNYTFCTVRKILILSSILFPYCFQSCHQNLHLKLSTALFQAVKKCLQDLMEAIFSSPILKPN